MMKTITLLFVGLLLSAAPASSQTRPKPRPKPAATAAPSPAFEKASAEATAAREAGNLEAAIPLYKKAVALRPSWDEGWWYLATLLYDRDLYEEAASAFKRTAALRPKAGAPLALQGLCEYRLARYDDAYLHIQQAKQIGIGENPELGRVMRYHEGTLLLLRGEFETAQRVFTALGAEGLNSQDLIVGLGLAVLRISDLPRQIGPDYKDRELIRRVGLAQSYFAQLNTADARQEFARLIHDFPKSPNLFYAYGRFLIDIRDDEAAMKAFEREIENSPSHALARLQIANLKMRNNDAAGGIPLAEEAIRLNRRLPLGHYLLGRLLFEAGDNARALEELEQAQRMAPTEPRIYYSLSRAYAKAGRRDDAARARETFARLNKANEEAAKRGDARADAIEEKDAEKPKP